MEIQEHTGLVRMVRRGGYNLVGALGQWQVARRSFNERGLSQSTENAVLLTGAVAIAITVIAIVTSYVTKRLKGLA